MRRVSLISFIIIILSIRVVHAQFEGAVWDTLTTDSVWEGLTPQALATTPYELHMTYAKGRPGGGSEVHYRLYDLMAGWDVDHIVESVIPCNAPVIAARYTNRYDIFIAFESGYDIWGWIAHDPSDWAPVNITNSPGYEYTPSLALDQTGGFGAWVSQIDSIYKIVCFYPAEDSTVLDTVSGSNLGELGMDASPFCINVGRSIHGFYRGVNNNGYHIHHAYKENPDSAGRIEFLETPNIEDYMATAAIDSTGDIHLAISGDDSIGTQWRIYYARRNHLTGTWSQPELATGTFQTAKGSIAVTNSGTVFIVSCGKNGNSCNGEVYLSDNGSGSFQTNLLASYQSCTQPVIKMISGIYGAIVFDAPIGGNDSSNYEIIYYGPSATGISESPVLNKFSLSQNFPNPFNAQTIIQYSLPEKSWVTIDIYDILGRKIVALAEGMKPAGDHQAIWDASRRSSGIYFYRIKAGDKVETMKMTLMK